MGSRMLCMSEAREGGARGGVTLHFPRLPVSMVLRYSASDVRRIAAARRCAEVAHRGMRRKVSGLPYIIHPLGVAVLLAAAGYGIDLVIAGLLHDAVEDGAVEPRDLERQFGETVARLVVSVTNTPCGGTWRERKTRMFEHIGGASRESLTLKCADALDNVRSIRTDLETYRDSVWLRLRSKDDLEWYFRGLGEIFAAGLAETPDMFLAAAFAAEVRGVFR